MNEIALVIFFVVGIIQLIVLFTFFGMNEKLGKIEFYLSRMARHSGALEVGTGQAKIKQGSYPKTPWVCSKCQHTNAYWDEACTKCEQPR
jgi:hypothetical protein